MRGRGWLEDLRAINSLKTGWLIFELDTHPDGWERRVKASHLPPNPSSRCDHGGLGAKIASHFVSHSEEIRTISGKKMVDFCVLSPVNRPFPLSSPQLPCPFDSSSILIASGNGGIWWPWRWYPQTQWIIFISPIYYLLLFNIKLFRRLMKPSNSNPSFPEYHRFAIPIPHPPHTWSTGHVPSAHNHPSTLLTTTQTPLWIYTHLICRIPWRSLPLLCAQKKSI